MREDTTVAQAVCDSQVFEYMNRMCSAAEQAIQDKARCRLGGRGKPCFSVRIAHVQKGVVAHIAVSEPRG